MVLEIATESALRINLSIYPKDGSFRNRLSIDLSDDTIVLFALLIALWIAELD